MSTATGVCKINETLQIGVSFILQALYPREKQSTTQYVHRYQSLIYFAGTLLSRVPRRQNAFVSQRGGRFWQREFERFGAESASFETPLSSASQAS